MSRAARLCPSSFLPPTTRDAIIGFLQYVVVERGLARATQAVYGRDVEQFFVWHRQQGCAATVDQLTRPAVRQFLEARQQQGWSMRSIARLLTALRLFDRWLTVEGLRPARLLGDLQIPRLPRLLPQYLSQAGVMRLLQQPSRTHPRGLRDLAMLEVLYGSGPRVSELVSLPMSALHLTEGWLKVRGKGSRERPVPMGEPEVAALRAYLGEPRALLLRGRKDGFALKMAGPLKKARMP